jgi:hypothetical protein
MQFLLGEKEAAVRSGEKAIALQPHSAELRNFLLLVAPDAWTDKMRTASSSASSSSSSSSADPSQAVRGGGKGGGAGAGSKVVKVEEELPPAAHPSRASGPPASSQQVSIVGHITKVGVDTFP